MKTFIEFLGAGSLLTGIFLFVVNMVNTPHTIWFIYPCLFLLLSTGAIYFHFHKKEKVYSIFTTIILICFFMTINYYESPNTIWFQYVIYPIIWWPILVLLGKKAGSIHVAIIVAIFTICYYGLLNYIVSLEVIWFIYPAFAILWWPLAIIQYYYGTAFSFSIWATLLISVFFILVNIFTTPNEIWAVYPIFAVLWWPLSLYFFVYKRKKIRI